MSRVGRCMYVNGVGTKCNAIGTVKIAMPNRGGRNACLCERHASIYQMEGYHTENEKHVGTTKVDTNTFGTEWESDFATIQARAELERYGFIPSSDGSINGPEFKSPVMEGLNAFSKCCVSIDRLIANNQLSNASDDCGTHFHFGDREYINSETMEYIRRFYHSLFIPLCEEMKSDREKTIKFWGRDFTYYARTIDESSSATLHENFINTQHTYSIEFRLCKYRNAEQFMRCVKFIKFAGNTICNNFIAHFNDIVPADKITEYRKHKAQVAAQKIVKKYRELIEEL